MNDTTNPTAPPTNTPAMQPAMQPTVAPQATPPEWYTRMVEEKAELDAKLARLKTFKNTDTYKALPPKAKHLMYVQERAMGEYSRALRERIDYFNQKMPA